MQINVSNIAVEYDGVPVLTEADFVIHDNEKIALVGRNGCGKTTLLKVLAQPLFRQSQARAIRRAPLLCSYILLIKQPGEELADASKEPRYLFSNCRDGLCHLILGSHGFFNGISD